jgi:hypothetical protein
VITPREEVNHVLVFGSREFRARRLVVDYVRTLTRSAILVSGGAPGVDALAYAIARKHMGTMVLGPRWQSQGHVAGPERNQWLADLLPIGRSWATGFWNLESSGTRDMLRRLAVRRRDVDADLRIKVCDEDGEWWHYVTTQPDGEGHLVWVPKVEA